MAQGTRQPEHPTAEILHAIDHLERGAGSLLRVPGPNLVRAWWRATDDLVTELPEDLHRSMADAAGLSPEGLAAGLDVVVRGVRTDAAREMLRSASPARRPETPLPPALVILSSNLPGLALQCLLPALAARRPLLLKTPSAETGFTPWLLERLAVAEPRLGDALAAGTWRGGDRALEDALLPRFERVIAYGRDGAIRDLERRATVAEELVGHGHRISLGVVSASPDLDVEQVARGLARDVALFDQRGCLSVHSVLVVGSGDVAVRLASTLRDALAELAAEMPPGAAEPGRLAAVRAAREEAVMAGHEVLELPLRQGTVILQSGTAHLDDETDVMYLESPGLRCVRIVPVPAHADLWKILEGWRGRLQGVALAVRDPDTADGLRRLGVTRIAEPGWLQEVDAAVWRNGGLDPLVAYAADRPAG